jgi:acyl-CoA synthetase (NDP forming)
MSPSTREGSSVISTLIDRRPILKAMLKPEVVALIGATEAPESVGPVLKNLHSFQGIVHLINGKGSSVPC